MLSYVCLFVSEPFIPSSVLQIDVARPGHGRRLNIVNGLPSIVRNDVRRCYFLYSVANSSLVPSFIRVVRDDTPVEIPSSVGVEKSADHLQQPSATDFQLISFM